ncbi:MAG: LLM class F420-dependent oxidoreductase [Chloroflexi bacterium]|nr:LLM class F420-dependent oxidoreductase [Chloroflexota bacterium]
MEIGVVFPQNEIGDDPGAVRALTQAIDDLGYRHVLAYDHVLGANPERPEGLKGPYTHKDGFWEVFSLFAYMAALRPRLGFITGVLVLPQRQTALAAKQAATLDVLCGGRFRLGVGNGWNAVEFEALGENFKNRGRRIEEQVRLLKRLFTEELVVFEGKFHKVDDAGLKPLPVQQPIPIWFGGQHENVLRRAGELGDGWLPGFRQAADAAESLAKIRAYAEAAGREPGAIGLEPRLNYGTGDEAVWAAAIEGWRAAGATHLAFNPLGAGFRQVDEHIAGMRRFAEFAGLGQ